MKLVTADDGRVYSTPTAETGGRAVFYNKDIFDENGWTIPTTFSEFEELLAKVAQTDYVPIALGATDPWDILFIWEPILAATHLDWIQEYETEGYAAVNDPRVADAYNKMIEWGDKGYFGDNWTGVTGQGASLAFSTGSAVMYIGGTWNISTFQENNPALNFGAFQIPCEDGQVPFVSTSSVASASPARRKTKRQRSRSQTTLQARKARKSGSARWAPSPASRPSFPITPSSTTCRTATPFRRPAITISSASRPVPATLPAMSGKRISAKSLPARRACRSSSIPCRRSA